MLRDLFSKKFLKEDLIAGLTVACVAVPLSLAIALASGVSPAIGLVTAIVAGFVCALFGGTPLSVSGPAAAMAVLIASIVQTHGVAGLLIVGLGCGLLQILFGLLKLGQFARFVPMPVIAGFTAGIGAVIFVGQLPRALGLPTPDNSATLNVIKYVVQNITSTNYLSVGLTLLTLAIIFGLPKVSKKIPAILAGVVTTSVLVVLFGVETQIIGSIPNSLPMPKLPAWPTEGLLPLLVPTLTVFGLASLETLLSCNAVDKISRGTRHNPNQELVGQGIGNIATSLFGGLPVTGVIARSALNVQAGAKTRRSSIIHSFVLLAVVYLASSWIAQIPITALAGVLLAVSLRMMNVREFKGILKVSKAEATVYTFTFVTILAFDLLIGIQVGVVLAILIAAIRASQTKLDVHEVKAGESVRVHITGNLTFFSSTCLESMRGQIDRAKEKGCDKFVIDLSDVPRIDATGAEELIAIIRDCSADGTKMFLQGVRPQCQKTLEKADHEAVLPDRIKITEAEVQKALYDFDESQGITRLVYGINRFRRKKEKKYQALLDQLVDGQQPHTLFLTCSDSRINPNLLTCTDLGELFVVRNVGNAFPPYSPNNVTSEQGAIEFAIKALGIREIVICGHTGCGAMKAICDDAVLADKPALKRYLESAAFKGLKLEAKGNHEEATKLNLMAQLENLLSYPFVNELYETGKLKVHLWIYDLRRADVDTFNVDTGDFHPISYDSVNAKPLLNNKTLPAFIEAEEAKPSSSLMQTS